MGGNRLTYNSISARTRRGDWFFGAISVGLFFFLVGILFITTPGLYAEIVNFFKDFASVPVPHTNVYLPAPSSLGAHATVYSAVQQFSLAWAVFMVAMLVGRIVLRAPIRRQAQNLGDAVFWFGAAYLVQTYLLDTAGLDLTRWFEFWASVVILAGLSLVARAAFLIAAREIA